MEKKYAIAINNIESKHFKAFSSAFIAHENKKKGGRKGKKEKKGRERQTGNRVCRSERDKHLTSQRCDND